MTIDKAGVQCGPESKSHMSEKKRVKILKRLLILLEHPVLTAKYTSSIRYKINWPLV